MQDKNNGLTIEGFVHGSYARMFDKSIDVRNHPLTTWAQATVSGNTDNFSVTKDNVLMALRGVQHTIYKEEGSDDLLNDLGEFEASLEASESLDQLADAIQEASPLLDQAFTNPQKG